ncbi:MAG TPA: RecX family transcriptional regulator [Candidatus Saccharibacteria bacterium]|nr:RecX family transcriptional regulator [Candidatus Saccharibacteria bacterium]
MKITSVSAQVRNPDRVNISIDGKYRLSLTIAQVVDLGIKSGAEVSEEMLVELEAESTFGKVYQRALEYCLMRPHSAREVRDYLYRKTRTTKYRQRQTGEVKERQGISHSVADRVFNKLVEKGYIDDERFAAYWVEHRNQAKGASQRKLSAELSAKGVDSRIIEAALAETDRADEDELAKVIAKKQSKYPDRQKFMQYLARQGFRYDDIKTALDEISQR